MSDSMVYARSPNVISTELDGEMVLLDTENWIYLEFDRIGAAIWGLLETPAALPALVDALTARYEVARGQCESDTKAFLDEMIGKGVVTATPG